MSERPTPETDAAKLNHSYGVVDIEFARKLERERNKYREAILYTLEENRHLADGDDCTLAKLKSAIPEWK